MTHVIGDRRTQDVAQLAEGEWDAVVDTCGYAAVDVARTASVLGPRIAHYCFVSTGAVYADMSRPLTEDSALVPPHDSDGHDLATHYAGLKVACEQALRCLLPSLSILRLGVVVGVGDYTDRLTYWVRRVSRGGRILGPPRAEQPLQLLHARDMAAAVLSCARAGTNICANVAGPDITFADLIAACAAASGVEADVAWGGPADLPLAGPADGSQDGGYRMSSRTGVPGGLTHQPLEATCREVLAWDVARAQPPLQVGPASPQAEWALITALDGRPGRVGVHD